MANYDKFDEVMEELISGDGGTTIKNFDSAALKEFAEHQDVFWDGLLQYLQNEYQKNPFNGKYGVRQNMFPVDIDTQKVTSVIEYINDNADLIDSFLDSCLAELSPQEHWNPSFAQLLALYCKYFVNQEEIDSTNITVHDIVNANAGNSFEENPWVIPNINIDNKQYPEVRKNDKIERILNDDKFLQFTHSTFKKYIRLLMPEYQRVVEVEDLNRNFWVIGQVLTGILSFLFDKDSPLNNLFNGILDELAQFWENLLYLWIAFALISQELTNNDVQIIVTPVPNDLLRPYIKFDDFDYVSSTGVLKDCWKNHFQYMKDLYNKSTVIIIPEIRKSKYQENYYAQSLYPGVIVYNRKLPQGINNLVDNNATDKSIEAISKERVVYYPIEVVYNSQQHALKVVFANDYSLRICDKAFINSPSGVYENSPNYQFLEIYSNSANVNQGTFVAAVRPIFTKDGNNPIVTFNAGQINSLKLSVKFLDVAKELYSETGESTPLLTLKLNYDGTVDYIKGEDVVVNDILPTFSTKTKKITKGWYRGEVPSYFKTVEPTFPITLRKEWQGIGEQTPKSDAVIKINGHDELGFKVEEITETFPCPNNDNVVTKTIQVPAYSNAGYPLDYVIKEKTMPSEYWISSSSNTTMNFNSPNKTASFVNKWVGIDFTGGVKQIQKIYSNNNSSSPSGGVYNNLSDFLNGLRAGGPEETNWNAWVDAEIPQMPANSARFFFSHFTYHYNDASQLEVTPFISLVIKTSSGTSKYSFRYEISDSTSNRLHSVIPYPYVSSVFGNSPAAASTELLCQWGKSTNPTSNTVQIVKPKTSLYADGYATKGNLNYGDAVFRENDGPSGTPRGIRLSFNGEVPKLSNYLILCKDRACVGLDGRSDFNNRGLISNPEKVKSLYPYYYKCEIKTGATANTFGIIKATVVYNFTKPGLTEVNSDFYAWASASIDGAIDNNRKYIYYTGSNEPYDNNYAQLAMGKIEYNFLQVFKPLLNQGGD